MCNFETEIEENSKESDSSEESSTTDDLNSSVEQDDDSEKTDEPNILMEDGWEESSVSDNDESFTCEDLSSNEPVTDSLPDNMCMPDTLSGEGFLDQTLNSDITNISEDVNVVNMDGSYGKVDSSVDENTGVSIEQNNNPNSSQNESSESKSSYGDDDKTVEHNTSQEFANYSNEDGYSSYEGNLSKEIDDFNQNIGDWVDSRMDSIEYMESVIDVGLKISGGLADKMTGGILGKVSEFIIDQVSEEFSDQVEELDDQAEKAKEDLGNSPMIPGHSLNKNDEQRDDYIRNQDS